MGETPDAERLSRFAGAAQGAIKRTRSTENQRIIPVAVMPGNKLESLRFLSPPD